MPPYPAPSPLLMPVRRVLLVVLLALVVLVALTAPPARAQYFGFGQNRVQYERHAWRTLQTEHIDAYYYETEGDAPGGRVLATFAAEAAEEAYRELAVLFGTDVGRRIPLIVYPTHAAFAATDAVDLPIGADGIGGVTELYKNRVAVPFLGDWREFRRVVHHELVHAVINDLYYGGSVQSLIRSGFRLQIPAWFNEGLAEWAALGWDTQSDLYVREAVLHDRLPEIPRLQGYFAYRGGQSVWDFVAHEYGREKVTEILERVRLGRSVPGAFRRATGLSLDELSDRWAATLRTVYFPEAAAREAIGDVARPLATLRRTGSRYHASPALSPLGDKVAFVAARDGLFDVLVVPTVGGDAPETLVEGQETVQFESLRLRTPGLAWSPDGRTLAAAVTSGPGDAVALLDVETGRVREIRPYGVRAIVSVAWSPDGGRLALEGTRGAHSDLFVVGVDGGSVQNLTRDLYSDHAPAWAPDGQSLVFHSDRGGALELGRATVQAARDGSLDARELGRTSADLFRVRLPASGALPERVERLTADVPWDATSAQVARGADGTGERILFVSDRNGVPNLYALEEGVPRPLTDLDSGVMAVSLSADGRRAAVQVLDEGVPSIYLFRDPFERPDLPPALAPTVWALRRTGTLPNGATAPALVLASDATRDRNALLRDAADGRPPEPAPRMDPVASARDLALVDSLLAALDTRPVARGDTAAARALNLDPTDPGRGYPVDVRAYRFSDAFDVRPRTDAPPDPFRPTDHRDADGEPIARAYRLRFTPDLVSASGGYDTVYGVQSVTQMLFSDMLGEHRIALATNLVLDLRNADYVLRYAHRGGRADWAVEGFHLARELPDFGNATVFRYRNFGLAARARYPLDRFRRVEAEVGLLGVSLTDLSTLSERPRTRLFAVPRLTATVDRTVPGALGPQRGTRVAASVSGAPGPDAVFATVLADGRRYWDAGPALTVAGRLSAGLSVGPNPQRFYASGVPNWLNASFRSLPVEGADDFVFATPVLPLRGFGFNEAAGDRFVLLNVEARAPLVAAVLPGPLPILPLYDLQAVAFLDAGVIADGGLDVWRTPTDSAGAALPRVFDDVLLGMGVGLRTVVLGYPLRADWAWPFDGRTVGDRRLYLSVGLDF